MLFTQSHTDLWGGGLYNNLSIKNTFLRTAASQEDWRWRWKEREVEEEMLYSLFLSPKSWLNCSTVPSTSYLHVEMLKYIFLLSVRGNKKPIKDFRQTKLPKFRIGAENFVFFTLVCFFRYVYWANLLILDEKKENKQKMPINIGICHKTDESKFPKGLVILNLFVFIFKRKMTSSHYTFKEEVHPSKTFKFLLLSTFLFIIFNRKEKMTSLAPAYIKGTAKTKSTITRKILIILIYFFCEL